MKDKVVVSFFASISLLLALRLSVNRQSSDLMSGVLFDKVRNTQFSPFSPKFTQIKRVTLRQMQSGQLQLNIQLASRLRLKPKDRLLFRVSVLRTPNRETSQYYDFNQMEIVFPIGYTYASYPPLISGSAGIVHYGSKGQKLVDHVPCLFGKESLTAVFNKELLTDATLSWKHRFTYADVLYIPYSAGGQKAYQKGITMNSSKAYADFLHLEEGPSGSRVMPQHPGSSWKDEAPTTLPVEVKSED